MLAKMFFVHMTSRKYEAMYKTGVSPSFIVRAYYILMLNCLEMIAPQLKPLPEIATM
jgi:hypothetical protein